MGNRALIKQQHKNLGVYLHWNGGIDSVTAFLKYCELKGYSGFETDYGFARFVQVVSNFFGGVYSIGVQTVENADAKNYDNGIYHVKEWYIQEHENEPGKSHEGYNLADMLVEIDKQQPKEEQLGEDFLRAEEIYTSSLKVGDTIGRVGYNGEFFVEKIEGFDKEEGMFYTNKYENQYFIGNDGLRHLDRNPNNYIKLKKVRRLKCSYYKDCNIVCLGGSDAARLPIVSPEGKDYLHFGEDGSYSAYIADETTEIPAHYHAVYHCKDWLEVYNDDTDRRNEVYKFSGEEIAIYRAGEYGCIIQVKNRTARPEMIQEETTPEGWEY